MHRNSNFPFMVEKEGVSLKTPGEEGWDAAAICISPSSEQLGAASSLRTALALARPGLSGSIPCEASGPPRVQMMALLAPVSVARL